MLFHDTCLAAKSNMYNVIVLCMKMKWWAPNEENHKQKPNPPPQKKKTFFTYNTQAQQKNKEYLVPKLNDANTNHNVKKRQ